MPTKLRALHGEQHLARLGLDEPLPREVAPVCPDHLDAYAAEVWDRTVADLMSMGLGYDCDREVLAAFCVAASRHREASVLLGESELLVEDEHGMLRANPLVRIERGEAELMARLASHFGLTPSARVGLKAEREEPASDAERLLS